jgi:hypothetical protein
MFEILILSIVHIVTFVYGIRCFLLIILNLLRRTTSALKKMNTGWWILWQISVLCDNIVVNEVYGLTSIDFTVR